MDTLTSFSPAFIVLATFVTMEGVAWFAHKYLMHGLMWYFHEDHHVHEPGFFEKNDAFFLIFAVPSAWCFITGSMAGGDFRVWIGTGIAAYGWRISWSMTSSSTSDSKFSRARKTST